MAKIELTNEQLHLIQRALDLYSRIGILQFWTINEHPSIANIIEDRFTSKEPLKVGSRTIRGEVIEINKKSIKTKGSWGNGEEIREWKDIENVKLSPDWSNVHAVRDAVRMLGGGIASQITGDINYANGNASYGIHHPNVDDTCRQAFDMIQVIRHEFWKDNENRSSVTVDSSIHFTSDKGIGKFIVEIDKNKKDESNKK